MYEINARFRCPDCGYTFTECPSCGFPDSKPDESERTDNSEKAE